MVFDVDGVALRGYFLLEVAAQTGLLARLLSSWDCFLFECGRIELETLLARVYGRVRGLPAEAVDRAYAGLRLRPGVVRAVAEMRTMGLEVWLVSSGVPQEIIDDLVCRVGADGGAGISAAKENGRLTGEVGGETASSDGKRTFVGRRLAERGLDWRDVIVIADDRCNLEIVRQAGESIGFRPTFSIRRAAKRVVDADDLARVSELAKRIRVGADGGDEAPVSVGRERLRKALHAAIALTIPLYALSAEWAFVLLTVAACFYATCEFFRLNGVPLPVFSGVMRRVARPDELRRPALGPLALAAGALSTLWLFPTEIACAAILIAAFGDSAASLVGRRLPIARLPHNPAKSLGGSLAAFVVSLVCALVYLPLPVALGAAAAAAAVESLDLGDWDNLFMPLVSAQTAYLCAALLWGLF